MTCRKTKQNRTKLKLCNFVGAGKRDRDIAFAFYNSFYCIGGYTFGAFVPGYVIERVMERVSSMDDSDAYGEGLAVAFKVIFGWTIFPVIFSVTAASVAWSVSFCT